MSWWVLSNPARACRFHTKNKAKKANIIENGGKGGTNEKRERKERKECCTPTSPGETSSIENGPRVIPQRDGLVDVLPGGIGPPLEDIERRP